MQFSVCNPRYFEIFICCEKCKQTAEISWLFFWDVKISKKIINKKFDICYRDIKTYLNLCGPSAQWEIAHLPDIHCLLSSQNWNGKSFIEKFNWFHFSDPHTVLHYKGSSFDPAGHCQYWSYLQNWWKIWKFFS